MFVNKLQLPLPNQQVLKHLNLNKSKSGNTFNPCFPFPIHRDFTRLLRLLCTCCWALRPCTIPLNDLNESLLYKQTIDYDSFKYLVEPLFNTPTLERRTAPSFGTWLTGAQYIVTQMERVCSV